MSRPIPKLTEMMAALVASPSVSSTQAELDQGNRAVIDLLAGWLEALGFAVDIQPLPGADHKANLIATLGEGDGGLVLAGHTDTVPCDSALWQSDPYQLSERDGRLYGLGVADMKAFIALAIEAAYQYAAHTLQRPLTILATADEESSMAGAKALHQAGRLRADYAVIGEPTSLYPVYMHKGVMMEAVTVYGQAGHSSDPGLGINALEIMHRVIAALIRWRDELQAEHRNEAFNIPVPTLNLGRIHGGDNPNRICPQCELSFDIRTLPGMDQEALRRAFRSRIDAVIKDTGAQVAYRSLSSGTPPLCTDARSPLVHTAEELTGHQAQAVGFATEGPYLQQLGMDTVILGPGDIDQAHHSDESLPVARLQPTQAILEGFIQRFCLQSTTKPSENTLA